MDRLPCYGRAFPPFPIPRYFARPWVKKLTGLITTSSLPAPTPIFSLGPVAYVSEVVSHYRRGHRSIWDDDARSSCSKVQLWEKHLKLIGNDKPELNARLQERLSHILFKLAAYQRSNTSADDLPIENFMQRGLAQLDSKNKLLFNLKTKIKLPARDLKKKLFG